MKKIGIISVFLTVSVVALWLFAQPFVEGKKLNLTEIKRRWGEENYNAEKFKNGDMQLRAKMAYSILNDKTLIGKSYTEIRKLFGAPDGFYFIDTYPAYIIQEGKNKNEETWQIVFKIGDGYKARDISVHKNCCGD
jgi:hypothetical protein